MNTGNVKVTIPPGYSKYIVFASVQDEPVNGASGCGVTILAQNTGMYAGLGTMMLCTSSGTLNITSTRWIRYIMVFGIS